MRAPRPCSAALPRPKAHIHHAGTLQVSARHPAHTMSAACFTLRLSAATAAAGSHPSARQGVARPMRLQQQPRLARRCRAAAAGGSPDAGADFLKQYKSLAADIMASAKPISSSSSSSSSDASEGSSSGCCGGSGAKEEVGGCWLEPACPCHPSLPPCPAVSSSITAHIQLSNIQPHLSTATLLARSRAGRAAPRAPRATRRRRRR